MGSGVLRSLITAQGVHSTTPPAIAESDRDERPKGPAIQSESQKGSEPLPCKGAFGSFQDFILGDVGTWTSSFRQRLFANVYHMPTARLFRMCSRNTCAEHSEPGSTRLLLHGISPGAFGLCQVTRRVLLWVFYVTM